MVKNVLHTQKISKAKNMSVAKNIQDKQTMIQAEHEEDNQTVKSLQFCKLKRCKYEYVEEWIKWLRKAAKECKYQELDRQVKEQFICGINNEYMQRKIDNELKVTSKTDEIMSNQVLMSVKQEEALRTQALEAGQTKYETRKGSTCRYCGYIHPPQRCPAYGKTCGECGRENHFRAVCRAPRWAA